MRITRFHTRPLRALAIVATLTIAPSACGDNSAVAPTTLAAKKSAAGLPDYGTLRAALEWARDEKNVLNGPNGGFNLEMWGTVVDRTGEVVAVAFTGELAGDQWPGSRVISAQKANTANAFSLTGLALSTANLYTAVQPGGTLFGLQASNPVDPAVAYGGKASDYGTAKDYMVGKKIGGINVFGGGLPLYNAQGELIGAVGVSGDASCADHNIAWKLRDRLKLDYVPGGVSATGDDNAVYDITAGVSASGWGHPVCSPAATTIGDALPTSHPTSKN